MSGLSRTWAPCRARGLGGGPAPRNRLVMRRSPPAVVSQLPRKPGAAGTDGPGCPVRVIKPVRDVHGLNRGGGSTGAAGARPARGRRGLAGPGRRPRYVADTAQMPGSPAGAPSERRPGSWGTGGARCRRESPPRPGRTPDLVFPGAKVAVFLDDIETDALIKRAGWASCGYGSTKTPLSQQTALPRMQLALRPGRGPANPKSNL